MSKIHPTAIVHDGARLGADVEVGPYSIVGPKVTLDDGVRLISHVVIEGLTEIGSGSSIYPFAVLGAAPQHLGHKGEDTRLVVGKNNIIREHVTMHTGTTGGRGVTTVGDNGLFMVGIHIAHDCIIGNNVVMANSATLGGQVQVADFVFMGGLCAIHQHSRIGRYAFVGGAAGVQKDVIPYGSVWGNHAHLEGLNLVGLKRRGFSRDQIRNLRSAYRLLFAEEGSFQERIDDTAATFADSPEVMEIVDFIRADAARSICLPHAEE
ncbi:MAG TPA: acyl-ACP--UDP-N-acetylglucosamine O-acyltransferase [Caulobacteraceae bacterium]|jgi:UDP-N-acetylglucosamine acyltransferase